jgi:hypothetical protein
MKHTTTATTLPMSTRAHLAQAGYLNWLREKGHRITLLNETQFWRLAGRPAGKRKRSR